MIKTNLNPQFPTRTTTHALVIGGSLAGLLAARVLTDHFDQVTILERDRLPREAEPRPGVPQSHHVHNLLSKGRQILEHLFPGLDQELAEAGAPQVNWTSEVPALFLFGWAPRFSSDLVTRTSSRTLLESLIRQRLMAAGHVTVLEESQAVNLLSTPDQTQITGVRIRREGEETEIFADLIVDACGRRTQTPQWLQQLGYPPPPQEEVNSFLGYASQWVELPKDFQKDWKVLLISAKPPHDRRGGVLFPIEGNRWILTLAGIGKDYPPSDSEGFMDFARSLRSSVIYDTLQKASPISPIYCYRRTDNRWLHYEKMSRWPENLVAIGDAVCAFNPTYGQGMSAAAWGAIALEECLTRRFKTHGDRNLKGFSRHFQRQLAQVIANPWTIATGEDLRWDTTEGGQVSIVTRWMHDYMDRILQLSMDNADIYLAFLKVLHLIEPPASLFHPRILGSMVKQAIGFDSNPAIHSDSNPTYPPDSFPNVTP